MTVQEEEAKVKAELDAAHAALSADIAKAGGYIKTHIAVIGAVVCLVIGFIAGRIA